jgi:MoaA/NifB/PqqE/SkfB family radical SAM enzyme
MHKNEKEYYIYKSVQEDNILPLTSKCNLSCIFCSHKQNPSDIEIISIGTLKKEKIFELIEFLDPNRPIIIGESATKIIEGEPLLYPYFKEIINMTRKKYTNTEIKITTNADLLDKDLLNFFEEIKNITLNISVNYLNSKLRKKIMGKNCNENIEKTLKLLNNFDLEYNFSMVALPKVVKYKIIEEEIIEMMKYNPQSIRVFMPGFTKNTVDKLKFNFKDVYSNLYDLIKNININNTTPVIIEPPRLKNFDKEIIGVIKDSPADRANIKYMDKIINVNNKKVITRVDAFNKIKSLESPVLEIKRKDKILTKKLKKEKDQKSGLILDYDLSLDEIDAIKRVIDDNKEKSILFLTSDLGYELINYTIIDYLHFKNNTKILVKKVKNTYLKGSILSAGLLTDHDIIEFLNNYSNDLVDLIVLPKVMYDVFNNDLCGNSYKMIEKKLGLEVEII